MTCNNPKYQTNELGGNPRREHLKLTRTLNLHIMGDASILKKGFFIIIVKAFLNIKVELKK
jgi:hypothetical protein